MDKRWNYLFITIGYLLVAVAFARYLAYFPLLMTSHSFPPGTILTVGNARQDWIAYKPHSNDSEYYVFACSQFAKDFCTQVGGKFSVQNASFLTAYCSNSRSIYNIPRCESVLLNGDFITESGKLIHYEIPNYFVEKSISRIQFLHYNDYLIVLYCIFILVNLWFIQTEKYRVN